MATDYLQAMGVGAGFDTKAIVTAIVDAEKAPKQSAIDRRRRMLMPVSRAWLSSSPL